MLFLLVRGDLRGASVLAGNKNAVHDALHAIAALGCIALAFWELATTGRADKVPFILKEASKLTSENYASK
jgi:hypothetical protein